MINILEKYLIFSGYIFNALIFVNLAYYFLIFKKHDK